MRYAAAAAALLMASPALATGGFECRPIAGVGPIVTVGLGHGVTTMPLFATLRDGSRTISTSGSRPSLHLGQIWIDTRRLWLDLTDANVTRHEAKLRAAWQPRPRSSEAVGTLWRGGRGYRVRCVEA